MAVALAGLRAHVARYFKNKYDHIFTVEPAAKAKKSIDLVNQILKEERGIVISSPTLEATTFEVENIRWTYVFYQDGLSVNVLYTLDGGKRARVQAVRRDGGSRRAQLVQVRATKVQAGRNNSGLVLRGQGRVLTPDPCRLRWANDQCGLGWAPVNATGHSAVTGAAGPPPPPVGRSVV